MWERGRGEGDRRECEGEREREIGGRQARECEGEREREREIGGR